MKKPLLILFSFVALVLSAHFANAQATPSPEKRALIKELLAVQGGNESTDKMMDSMFAAQEAEAGRMLDSVLDSNKVLSAQEKADMKRRSVESLKRMAPRLRTLLKEINIEQLTYEAVVPIYEKNFSETELRELVAFHRSPVGQKSINLAEEVMAASMKVFFEKVMPRINDLVKTVVDEEFAQLKEELPAKPAAPKKKP